METSDLNFGNQALLIKVYADPVKNSLNIQSCETSVIALDRRLVLKVNLTSRKKPKSESTPEKIKLKPYESTYYHSIIPALKINLFEIDDKSTNIQYCSQLYLNIGSVALSNPKIYSSSEQQSHELQRNGKPTFVSSYHTYILNSERINNARTHMIEDDAQQKLSIFREDNVSTYQKDEHQHYEKLTRRTYTSIYRKKFVSQLTFDVNTASQPITSSEMNDLVRSKMCTTRQSNPVRRYPRKPISADFGYLQNLILQSHLILCNPLDEDSDSESDLIKQVDYMSDFCYFDILDLDIVYQIFHLLPTRDLAVLKCVCQDFKWLIEFYDIGGVDSKWSESNSYRDDPCMHCGKIKDPSGDVSLCRWHPKGYYKDGHYGRHYWICCRQSQEDAAGCLVGVHDNNWTTSRERLCHIPKPKRKQSSYNDEFLSFIQ
ncbi:uncharacterized protein [Antedon mediterranea]|uniref:uncharacterized protein n=1 Tax=Antedon mediterranea TaxID=105859 RepID=UPI003AF7D3EE